MFIVISCNYHSLHTWLNQHYLCYDGLNEISVWNHGHGSGNPWIRSMDQLVSGSDSWIMQPMDQIQMLDQIHARQIHDPWIPGRDPPWLCICICRFCTVAVICENCVVRMRAPLFIHFWAIRRDASRSRCTYDFRNVTKRDYTVFVIQLSNSPNIAYSSHQYYLK